MFLLNSRSHLVSVTLNSVNRRGCTFSRSYGTILPSSFTRVLSSALEFSSHPPVLVWGTDTYYLKLRGFSWKHGVSHSSLVRPSHSRFNVKRTRIFLSPTSLRLDTQNQLCSGLNLLRHPIASNKWYRNINLFSIDYASRPRLRIRLTLLRLALSRKPWVFGGRVFHPSYRYSCQHSHF